MAKSSSSMLMLPGKVAHVTKDNATPHNVGLDVHHARTNDAHRAQAERMAHVVKPKKLPNATGA